MKINYVTQNNQTFYFNYVLVGCYFSVIISLGRDIYFENCVKSNFI